MDIQILQYVRLIAPGVMIYGVMFGICWATKWCKLALPRSYDEVAKLVFALVFGVIYNVTDLSEWSNLKYFLRVQDNIVARLTEPFKNDPEVPQSLTWQRVRAVFYHIIDSDESLKIKAKLAYWNGALWTSVADLRAVAALGLIVLLGTFFVPFFVRQASVDEVRLLIVSVILFGAFALSFYFSDVLTVRQMAISDEQIENIKLYHLDELKRDLIKAAS